MSRGWMRAIALLAALLVAVGAEPLALGQAPDASAAAKPVDGSVRATLVPSPAEVEIGEPVEWLLDVVHPRELRVKFPEKPAEDRAWAPLGERVVVRAADPGDPALVHTIARWSAMALDSGELAPLPLELELAGGGTAQKLAVEGLSVHVAAALGEGEDAPRPLLGFRALPPELEPSRRGAQVLAALLGVLVLGLAAFWLARRRRPPVAPALPTPLARLDALAARLVTEPESARAVVFELSRLVRGSVDAFLAVDRSGCTDEDWTRAVKDDERVPLGVRNTSARLLASAERVKYAQETPTRFAVDEFLKDARAALEALSDAPRPFVEAFAA